MVLSKVGDGYMLRLVSKFANFYKQIRFTHTLCINNFLFASYESVALLLIQVYSTKTSTSCSLCHCIKESARAAAELARDFAPEIECKWGDAGLDDIIQDNSVHGVAIVLAGQTQV